MTLSTGSGPATVIGVIPPGFTMVGQKADFLHRSRVRRRVANDHNVIAVGSAAIATGDPNLHPGEIALARYVVDGSLDSTFDADGTVMTLLIGSGIDEAEGVALQSDGKIVVAGNSRGAFGGDFALIRYNADGSIDPTFGPSGDGRVVTDVGSAGVCGRTRCLRGNRRWGCRPAAAARRVAAPVTNPPSAAPSRGGRTDDRHRMVQDAHLLGLGFEVQARRRRSPVRHRQQHPFGVWRRSSFDRGQRLLEREKLIALERHGSGLGHLLSGSLSKRFRRASVAIHAPRTTRWSNVLRCPGAGECDPPPGDASIRYGTRTPDRANGWAEPPARNVPTGGAEHPHDAQIVVNVGDLQVAGAAERAIEPADLARGTSRRRGPRDWRLQAPVRKTRRPQQRPA